MAKYNDIQTVFVDFDGVIARNSLEVTMLYAHDFINQYTPYHYESLKNYYLAINSFDLKEGVTLLFKSLGLENHLVDFITGLNNLKEYRNVSIKIQSDYPDFISFCNSNNISCKIFSLAHKEKIENLLEFSPEYLKLPPGNISKANSQIFKDICKLSGCSSSEIILIDDDPFVLRSAKLAGLMTVLMKNEFYNSIERHYRSYIDIKVDSFSEIQSFLRSS